MSIRTGILLVNLGTPDSPKPSDVYRYLNEFLTDGRVIDIPWITRQLLVRGFIVPTRYRQSAAYYKVIWTPEGSPLKVYGLRVQEALQQRLGDNTRVELAMRYQNPSIPAALARLRAAGIERLLVYPLFPQYASATTGSVHQRVMEEVSTWNVIPEVHLISHYEAHPALIRAFCAVSAAQRSQEYDHILFSFHGLPQRQLLKADSGSCCLKGSDCCQSLTDVNRQCYSAQCHATAQALVKALHLDSKQFSIAFQSRLGKEPWIQPYTSDVITHLAKTGKKRVLVFCPSFVCDCLETLHEIGVEYAAEFKHAGGTCLDLVPGLNDHPQWVDAIAEIIQERLK